MTAENSTICIIELFLCLLLIFCFMREEKFIHFEQNIKRIIKGNYKRAKRYLKKHISQLIRAIDYKKYKLICKKYYKYSAKLTEYRYF